MKFKFFMPDLGETEKDAIDLETNYYCADFIDMAEEAALYYYDMSDGYEDKWPIKFAIIHDGITRLVEVYLEYSPSFKGNEIEWRII